MAVFLCRFRVVRHARLTLWLRGVIVASVQANATISKSETPFSEPISLRSGSHRRMGTTLHWPARDLCVGFDFQGRCKLREGFLYLHRGKSAFSRFTGSAATLSQSQAITQ